LVETPSKSSISAGVPQAVSSGYKKAIQADWLKRGLERNKQLKNTIPYPFIVYKFVQKIGIVG